MGAVRFLGLGLFAAGVASIAVAFWLGEATLSLVVIIPVITATGPWAVAGILLIVAGFIVTFLTWPARPSTGPMEPPMERETSETPTQSGPRRRWGGVVFLGPIPIVFGSDARVTQTMLVLALVLFLALLVLTILLFAGAL